MERLVLILLVASAVSASDIVLPKWVERIIGGQDAEIGSHPHQISLQWSFLGSWYFLCGGSVIKDNVVLTAAHCVAWDLGGDFVITVNDHILTDIEGREQTIHVQHIIPHHDYVDGVDADSKAYPHDVAVLILAERITNKSSIITMAEPGADFVGETCVISGWGYNESNGGAVDTLQEVNMTIMSKPECDAYWGEYVNLFPGQICVFAGENPFTGASACSGDSGGPLVCNGLLAGVTSWGITGCRHPEYGTFWPSVYASVSHYRTWIDVILGRYQLGRG